MKLVISEKQFKQMISLLKESVDKKLNVLFVGDSLSSEPGFTWNYLLAKKHSDWDSTHIAQRGKITKWMKDEVSKELKNKKYDIVFVYGGTNDIFNGLGGNSAKSNLEKIIGMVADQGGKTYIYSGYDAKSMSEKLGKKRDDMIKFQESLENLSGSNFIVIPPTPLNSNEFASDKSHITGGAHSKMANDVDSFISGNLPTPKETSYIETLFGFKKGIGEENMLEDLLSDLKEFNGEINYKGSVISDDIVFQIQTGLQLLGYSLPVWGIDGKFGPETKRAVKSLQEDLGLETDGIVNSSLMTKLVEKLKSENINDSDFKELNIERKSSMSDIDISKGSFSGEKFEKIALKIQGEEFVNKVNSIAKNLNISPEIILATMYFESGFKPDARNPKSSATGLIQFMPNTAKGLGTSIDELKNMSAIKQLDYVYDFYNKKRGLLKYVKSPEDGYLLVFYPYALSQNDDFILGSEVSPGRVNLIANQNKGFDSNNDNQITKREVLNFIRKKWGI